MEKVPSQIDQKHIEALIEQESIVNKKTQKRSDSFFDQMKVNFPVNSKQKASCNVYNKS